MTDAEKEQKLAQTTEDLEDLTIDCTCLGIANDECDKCFRRKIANYVLEREEKGQKEVFEKIYQRLKEIKVVENNCNGYLIIGAIQDLEKEFGEEVGE